ncbi:DNA helicase MCM8 isoform X1 [Petromyzon marinus]|uniref:DNA helicase MCM8 n=1 Tax=Petromyzon marinus TaxID=7757 RepID=A0AAJ7TL36_PETMA|nr:DNA helicase MCM8 isoform X1 [Petromyzon marinus]XP_032818838.1 DNA helicase MCM8 isoform X1 [Petromyzon marinus]XP_032818839.1 DNA helicase MCM8 isoform X1 [Petromyzon marinus]XP_032818840.1 DNA helicase MCM8 isoform X1 [Petromyzon marinus]
MSEPECRGRGGGGWLRGGHRRGSGGNWRGRYNGRGGGGGSCARGGFNVSSPKIPSSSCHARVLQTTLDDFCPYPGWKLYFPSEVYCNSGGIVTKVEVFEKFFFARLELYNKDEIEEKGSILVDFKELVEDHCLTVAMPTLADDLAETPDRVLQYMGLAVHQTLTKDLESQVVQLQQQADIQQEEAPTVNVPLINVRIYNYEPLTQLKNLRANCYGRLVAIRGTVVRVGNIKPLCTRLAFSCNACGTEQVLRLPYGKFTLPTKCADEDCRSRTFMPNRRSQLTETVDWQNIKVQELMHGEQREAGRIPRTVECELTHDLVDSCVPGDVITLTGIVKVASSDEGRNKSNKDKCMFLLYIQAVAVSNTKGQRSDGGGEDTAPGVALDFSLKELYAVQEIQAQPHLFRLLVHSICPTIYGHELVKAGLALALFGGVQRYGTDKNRIPVRGDPHVLIVGDPGLGKSQMLQAVCNIAPRGVYVCGNTTTTAGLTVTLSKDGPSGDYALEAGALVLGDQGLCCIDEFDKMPNQHQALLEAMEQQSISLAKAGVVCSLPARTSIVAAANPVCGHYNKSKTVSENLKMGSALLSRFDLVFILVDTPDEERDHVLSEHVMAMHAGKRMLAGASVSRAAAPGLKLTASSSSDDVLGGLSLSDRLKARRGEALDPVPHSLLRKYVGYARRYVRPCLSAEAAQTLQDFYLELRRQHHGGDGTPITTRQLESLIRLTEARARLELRENATKEDADDVIDIMKHSFSDTLSDELGTLHFERTQHGSGMSNRSAAKRFVTALARCSEQICNTMFTMQQLQQLARDIGLQVADFEGFISSLNTQGFLLHKGSKVYQLQAM